MKQITLSNQYRLMGLAACVSAFFLSLADFLLEFNPSYGVSTSDIVEPAWATMAAWRFSASLSLCAFFIPLYLCGFYLLYVVIRQTNKKVALLVSLCFSYGLVMGAPLVHAVMALNPLIYQYGLRQGISVEILVSLIEKQITGAILPVFIVHYLVTWVLAPSILFVHIISGKSNLPRWSALLNPLVFLIFGMAGLAILPGLFKYLTPGIINKGNLALFLLLTCKTWNCTNITQEGGKASDKNHLVSENS